MGVAKTLIRINLRERPDLLGAILKANAYLINNNAAGFFATLLYAAFDPASGAIEYVSCGHLPAVMRRADGAVEAKPAGSLPIGVFDELKPIIGGTTVRAGDLFFLYTDGVTEATDPEGNQFGERRLIDLLAEPTGTDAGGWVTGVSAAVPEFSHGAPQSDDVTCLALVAA